MFLLIFQFLNRIANKDVLFTEAISNTWSFILEFSFTVVGHLALFHLLLLLVLQVAFSNLVASWRG